MRFLLTVLFCGLMLSLQLAFASNSEISQAYKQKTSNVQIQGVGVVVHILPDDLQGSRHQKFIIELDNKQTILIAHNIDLANRINSLNIGDMVRFYGEYEWSSKGGVVHWTHHDPRGRHTNGWLKHNNTLYQ